MISSDDADGTTNHELSGTATSGGTFADSWTQAEDVEADIVFALDQSDSLGDDHEAMLEAFPDLLEALADAGVDYRVMALVDDDGCPTTSGYAEPSMDSETATELFGDQMSSTSGSMLTEKLLTLFANAAAETGSGQCNEHAFRDEARLVLVPVSDEDDQSSRATSYYVEAVQELKDDPEQVRFLSWTADPSSYTSSSWCGDGGTRYADAVSATDGELIDICSETAGTLFDALVDTASQPRTRFALSGEPYAPTLVVTVDGVETTDYTLDGEVLVFDDAPDGGAEITADFLVAGSCE